MELRRLSLEGPVGNSVEWFFELLQSLGSVWELLEVLDLEETHMAADSKPVNQAQLLYVTGSLEIMNAEASLLFAAGGLRDSFPHQIYLLDSCRP